MSSTLLTKASKGKGPAMTDDAEDNTLPPAPVYKSGRHKKQPVDRSAVVPTIPSGSTAVDEDPPVILTVEGINDQSDGNSLPSELEAARQEIAALRAMNAELRRPVASKKRGRRNRKKRRPNLRSHRTSDPSSSPSGTQDSDVSDSSTGYRSRRSRSPRRSHKIEDPDKLDSGTNPTYKQWKDLMDGKMYQNSDWWKTEKDRMFYVFRMTEGKARDYLHTRWGVDSYDPFVDTADMFEFLRQNFTNPNEVREAKDAYTELKQGQTPFPEFRAQFLMLAMQGHIPRSEFKDDLFRKLNPRVRELLSVTARRLTYEELCESALDVDIEVRTNQKLAIARRLAKETPTTTLAQGLRPSTRGILPIRQSLPLTAERSRRLTSAPPDQNQRSNTAEKEDTCHNCGKPGHWAKECPDPPRPRIHEIDELFPRIIEVDTDDEEAGVVSQPENGDA
jgi:hypothetical protein